MRRVRTRFSATKWRLGEIRLNRHDTFHSLPNPPNKPLPRNHRLISATLGIGVSQRHAIVVIYCMSFRLRFMDRDSRLVEATSKCLSVVCARVFGPSNIQAISLFATLSCLHRRRKKYLHTLEQSMEDSLQILLGSSHQHVVSSYNFRRSPSHRRSTAWAIWKSYIGPRSTDTRRSEQIARLL